MKRNVGIIGNTGRMGVLLTRALQLHPRYLLGEGFSRSSQTSLKEVVLGNDIFIDFSAPGVTATLLDSLLDTPKPVIIGTTGFSADSGVGDKLTLLSEKVPVVVCPNTSLGAYVQKRLTAIASKMFDASYDVRIRETHHRTKADAISGTALALAETIRSAKKELLKSGQQLPIEIQGSRVGNVLGEHEVSFIGENERFVICHEVFSRNIFVDGVLLILDKIVEESLAAGYYTSDILYERLFQEMVFG